MHSTYAEKKVKEVLAAFENHTNLIITGAECCGKSSLISVVMQILSDQGVYFKQYNLNPMSLAAIQDVNSWNDNSLSEVLKAILQSKKHKRKCIIFDGPLNDIWLDTILVNRDCVKSASLNVSSEENVVKLIIETVDLQCATPAYIDRFSIINVKSQNVTGKHIMSTWLERKTWPTFYIKDELQILTDKSLDMFLNFIHQECSIAVEYTDVTVLHTFCALFENIFFKWDKQIYEKEDIISEAIRKLFIFCCIWSIGGLMNETERLKYDIFVREFVSDSASSFPLKGNIFQYCVTFIDGVSIWELWSVNSVDYSR
ncbi:dynein axonemal heavy chain 6 [Aedes albopictus]|uniref:Dynein heavy chain AAA 5 extension domain-containing protein n=1 Tax=Aedes albopictus TaxID=7160 RepID=A0ABM1ZW56_AEDAL